MTTAMQRTRIRLTVSGYECAVQSLTGEEALNAPTRLTVTTADDLPFELDELLNQPVALSLTGPGALERRFSLTVFDAEEVWTGPRPQLTLHLASKVWRGREQFHSRLFMDQPRDRVIRQLLAEMGYAPDEVDLRLDPVPAHEGPFLQARESNRHCLERLLAEVGANYWFEPAESDYSERLVIRNDPLISPYLPHIEWAQATSGLAPDQQLNRITAAYRRWRWQPATRGHAVTGSAAGAQSNDRATHQSFEPPRPRSEAEQRALFAQQHRDQSRYTLELHSHQPLLTAGHTLSLDAHQLPVQTAGDFRIMSVQHHAEPTGSDDPASGGVQYRNTADVIPRATAVRPALTTPPDLPQLFPARIESRRAYAELGADGRYYFRYDFDRSDQPHAQASQLTERLAPYASPMDPEQGKTIGWHFPLLNRSTVMVSCLNNDPARPLILGFVPSRGQLGPVTNKNATQSRIVTPGQSELTFDDAKKAECIALHTFDRQLCLELNAAQAEPYCQILAQFGGIRLYAEQNLDLTTDNGNLDERIGADRSQTVKQNSATTTEEGAVQYQAKTEQHHTAQLTMTQAAEGDYSLWVQEKHLRMDAKTGHSTTVDAGDYQLQVQDGAVIHQVAGDITILGNGGGDILLVKGDAGIKMDAGGNIKLFGAKITLKGQGGVTFNGDVQYETGAGNEPEEAEALNLEVLSETGALSLDGTQPVEGSSHAYQRDTQAVEEDASEWADIEIVDAAGNPVPHREVVVSRPDGSELLARTDQYGYLHIRKSNLKGATARVLNRKVKGVE
ncbi:type VI secretion system Vgr family protein [Saccharospirillum salsuginis]|uniref:Type VI secretion system tip protein VgrG n=1 Tax=Saccharospirillum salsuginis TaxID=418750 RepID=A0A918NB69_9GAMM|nr:type VI secretion system Vgr family protein [Saccharospirillum salsuginis]GGX59515.1 hypothetical protein GCM10007392_29320 [Saccharospirillum salsuginis]